MRVCMCVRMCVRVCVYARVHNLMFIHNILGNMFLHTCICMRQHICKCTCVYTCMCVRIFVHICMCIYVCVNICVCIPISIRTRTCTCESTGLITAAFTHLIHFTFHQREHILILPEIAHFNEHYTHV